MNNQKEQELVQQEIDRLYAQEDMIEGVEHKSLSQIIEEVAEEEGMTQEEVRNALTKMAKDLRLQREKKQQKKKDSDKNKKKKKSAKKSRKKNR